METAFVSQELQLRICALETEQKRQQQDIIGLAQAFRATIKKLSPKSASSQRAQSSPSVTQAIPQSVLKQRTVQPVRIEPTSNGYVICLLFGQTSAFISEWADDRQGWRSPGSGSRYATRSQAQQKLAELQEKWPDYPIAIRS